MITFVNLELGKIFGYIEEDLLGQDVQILIPEKYRKAHNDGMRRHMETGKTKILGQRLEMEGLHKNGTCFPISIRIEEAFINYETFFFTAAIEDLAEDAVGLGFGDAQVSFWVELLSSKSGGGTPP